MNRLFWVLLLLLSACGDKTPIPIGFLGGTSGRFADLGAAGRNGAQLAVDQRNAAGGVRGRQLVLIAEDDKQDSQTAEQAFRRLQRAGVQVMVGPMTSSVAMAVKPLADEARVLMVSPTVTTALLSGKDDYFFRVVADVRDFAEQMATVLNTKHLSNRVVLITDAANAEYSSSWATLFTRSFSSKGGTVVSTESFDSRFERGYDHLAEQVLRGKPSLVVMVTSATDAALIAQKLKEKDPAVILAGTGWSGTSRLIELGGKAVDGMLSEQYYNPKSTAPAFVRFRQDYLKRFGDEPGFAATLGYDAASVVIDALANNPDKLSLKAVLLRKKRFAGLQEEIVFDEFGDAKRPRHMTFVRGGRFEPLD